MDERTLPLYSEGGLLPCTESLKNKNVKQRKGITGLRPSLLIWYESDHLDGGFRARYDQKSLLLVFTIFCRRMYLRQLSTSSSRDFGDIFIVILGVVILVIFSQHFPLCPASSFVFIKFSSSSSRF